MDIELIKYLGSLGVGGALAGFMFIVYRRDAQRQTEQWKGQAEMLVRVVQDNTAAMTSLTKVIEQIDRWSR